MSKAEGRFQKIIYYIYGFLVLWEWLRPLDEVTDTGNLSIFFYFIAFSYLLAYLKPPFLVVFSAKVLFIAYFIHSLFYQGSFFEREWIGELFQDLGANVGFMLAANWWEMTNSFRSILFFVLLWLLAYLMEYWIVQLKKIFLFLILTITYLAILDTFTPYDASQAIVRMIVFGFLILGLLRFERLKDKEGILVNKQLLTKWLVPLVILTLLTTTLGYLAPKAAPIWPDPIPYLKGYGEASGMNGVKRIGYGTNDSRLGGAFIGDETVVFTAETTSREYWRVETKDIYTGKGWEASKTDLSSTINAENLHISMLDPSVETVPSEAVINVELGYPHIVYPVELQGVKTDLEIEYKINTSTEKVMTERSGQPYPLEQYGVVYNDPQYKFENLRITPLLDDPYIASRYTQLPDNTPIRVRELAEEIIAPFSNRYDQVKAVESYFRRSGFVYETKDVAVPGNNDDYVDQFLFETLKGYCDNFSTSMAVLLRSVGIPSRWVKGYTGGDYIQTLENNTRMYEVKNANAHSWVEVYFPGSGWVPFEPTMGFSNPYDFSTNQEQDAAVPVPNLDQEQPDREREDLLAEEEEKDTAGSGSSWSLDITFTDVLKIAGVLIVLGVIIFFTRRKWYPFYILQRYGKFKNSRSFEKAYFVLVHALRGYGLKKKESQTLREYAAYVDSFFYSKEMRKLTLKLEGIQYQKDYVLEKKDIESLRELWENLIKRVSS
ncbi:transglutaminaseTgpA domain-containing protein [Bacillus sp. DJP31]|uniref:transglutaminaseTgpA domain-containing protein n=1 Tax=Bacillus sp. DJP31 TaxID=3409789 RepID=UPI003BB6D53C